MPKTKQQKQETIANLADGLKRAKAVVFANFQGLTVAAFEELRRLCHKEDIGVLAVKKTLAKRALTDVGFTEADPKSYKGGIAFFMGYGDEVAPARIVSKFAKDHEVVAIYGGVLEGKIIDTSAVKFLAALPSKLELYAQLLRSMNASVTGFVNALTGNLRNLVSVLNNIKEAKV